VTARRPVPQIMLGHQLAGDGAAFNLSGVQLMPGTNGIGRARCECNWYSGPTMSREDRVLAHRSHKREVVEKRA
jgi:hypothetical protein